MKVVGVLGGWAEKSAAVSYSEYGLARDLGDVDLIGLLGKPKEEVGQAVAPLADIAKMGTRRLALERLKTVTGHVADEVHYFPNLTKNGSGDYTFLFQKGKLIGVSFSPNVNEANSLRVEARQP